MEVKQLLLLQTLCVSLTYSLATNVFLGCQDGIYSAEAKSDDPKLDFNKIVSTKRSVLDISYHKNSEQLFYSINREGIYKCDFNGADQEQVLPKPSSGSISSISVHANTFMFWTNLPPAQNRISDSTIYRANIDGTNMTSIAAGSLGIAVDVYESRIYWASYADTNVKSALYDGNGTEVVLKRNLKYPVAVAIDELERTLFTADTGDQYHDDRCCGGIIRKNLKTNQLTDLYYDINAKYIVDIAILSDTLLFIESKNRRHSLKSVPKAASGPVVAQQVATTGLENCTSYYSIHVVQEFTTNASTVVSLNTATQIKTPKAITSTSASTIESAGLHDSTKGQSTTERDDVKTTNAPTVMSSSNTATQIKTSKAITSTPASTIESAGLHDSTKSHQSTTKHDDVKTTNAPTVMSLSKMTRLKTTKAITRTPASTIESVGLHASTKSQSSTESNDIKTTDAPTVMSLSKTPKPKTPKAITRKPASTIESVRPHTSTKGTERDDIKTATNDYITAGITTKRDDSGATTTKKVSVYDWISTFDAAAEALPFDDNLNQTKEYAKQRFRIERNQTVVKQLVIGNLTYKVVIPAAAAISLDDNVGFVVITVLTSLNPSTYVNFRSKTSDVKYKFASYIVSINLFNLEGNSIRFSNARFPVKVIISLQKRTSKSSEFVCAFWRERNWSLEGVSVSEAETNESHLTCLSTHLTTFAGLFRFTEQREYPKIVKTITNIGSGASIIALMLGLSAFGILKNSSNLDSSKILVHTNLMIAMFVAYILLIFSEVARANNYVCLTITILLFDAFMSVFAWTTVEAIHLFRMIVVVYGIERDLKWLYMFIGWGIPLLITGATSAIGRGQLIAKNPKQCWLDGGYIWAFIGPVVFILLINMVILGIVIHKTISAVAGHDNVQSVKTTLRSMLLLMPMLGVAWVVGLAVNVHVSIGYMFDTLSSLQGVYLVVVICILNTEIREGLKREWKKHRNVVDDSQVLMRKIATSSSVNTKEITVENIEYSNQSPPETPEKNWASSQRPQRDLTPWTQYLSDSDE